MRELESVELPKIEDFYDLNYEKGEIRLRGVKGRAFVLSTQAWAAFRVALSNGFKEEASFFVFQMGYSVGMSYVEQIRKLQGEPKKRLKILLSIAKSYGWGPFSIDGDADNATELIVVAKNCPFCHGRPLSESPVCHFLTGFVNGLIDRLYDGQHKASETKCTRMGGTTCEITITEMPAENQGRMGIEANEHVGEAILGEGSAYSDGRS